MRARGGAAIAHGFVCSSSIHLVGVGTGREGSGQETSCGKCTACLLVYYFFLQKFWANLSKFASYPLLPLRLFVAGFSHFFALFAFFAGLYMDLETSFGPAIYKILCSGVFCDHGEVLFQFFFPHSVLVISF